MTADAFRLDQKKKAAGKFLEMKERPSRDNESNGRRAEDVKSCRPFHRRQTLSNRQGGNTHGHVITRSCEGAGHRSDQFA